MTSANDKLDDRFEDFFNSLTEEEQQEFFDSLDDDTPSGLRASEARAALLDAIAAEAKAEHGAQAPQRLEHLARAYRYVVGASQRE